MKNLIPIICAFILFVAPSAANTLYEVKPGDTFWEVAQRNGIALEKLEKNNAGMLRHKNDFDRIYPGQIMDIPEKSVPKTHTVKCGDTFSKIAQRYGIGLEELKEVNSDILKHKNDYNKIYPGQVITLPTAEKISTAQPQSGKTVPELPSQAQINQAQKPAEKKVVPLQKAEPETTAKKTEEKISIADHLKAVVAYYSTPHKPQWFEWLSYLLLLLAGLIASRLIYFKVKIKFSGKEAIPALPTEKAVVIPIITPAKAKEDLEKKSEPETDLFVAWGPDGWLWLCKNEDDYLIKLVPDKGPLAMAEEIIGLRSRGKKIRDQYCLTPELKMAGFRQLSTEEIKLVLTNC